MRTKSSQNIYIILSGEKIRYLKLNILAINLKYLENILEKFWQSFPIKMDKTPCQQPQFQEN